MQYFGQQPTEKEKNLMINHSEIIHWATAWRYINGIAEKKREEIKETHRSSLSYWKKKRLVELTVHLLFK